MEQVKHLVLGAGPAGLCFAKKLQELGEESFLILEKEEEAGGLCRSCMVDGSPFDIGGGHFLDVTRPEVNAFLFQFLPEEEWNLFHRDSRIRVKNHEINHPFEAHIWQLPLEEQVEYLESIAKAGCNLGEEMPKQFVDWIHWKLGDKIAKDYMIPYNQKMFADQLDSLGTYWLEKLPNVSFRETLLSCLEKKMYGKQPGHASFYYPKAYGYGEVWLRIGASMKAHIQYGQAVKSLDLDNKQVVTVNGKVYCGEKIITTIPWNSIENLTGLDTELLQQVRTLKSSAIETRYVAEDLDTKAHWIYMPDENLPYHRILVRHNFCTDSKGYWLETRTERIGAYNSMENTFSYINEYAYPLNTCDKPEIMDCLLKVSREKQVYGLGRWGEHSHYNSDVTVEKALHLAQEMYTC